MSVPNFPLFNNIVHYANKENNIAIDDVRMNKSFSYNELIHAVAQLRLELLNGKSSLEQDRIAILCP
ncbi:hypothetical protein CU098_009069, partial [Rhizopus stolonifer]